MKKSHLLLVEDDTELGPMIVAFLSDAGYRVEWLDNGAAAVKRLSAEPAPDLTILDVKLPELSGIEVCRQARTHYSNPILMLTASNDELTEINSLNRGADAYLTKPVRPHVLLAHIKSLLRRVGDAPQAGETTSGDMLSVQDLSIHPRSLSARIDDQELPLTTAEYQLLEHLARHAGRLVTREQLYRALRGIEYDGVDRAIDMRVSVLRKKMDDAIPPFRYIKTVRGKGYLLALE
jgi:DNA-binding response OmpR family regulator